MTEIWGLSLFGKCASPYAVLKAIGLMVILAGVNFYVHLLAPYTIQSSITLSTGKVSITLSMRDMKGLHLIFIILKFKRVFPELLKLVEFLKIN